MPIHDQSYRHYGGGRALPGRSWTVIARAGIMTMVRKRVFLLLLLSSMGPFLYLAVRAWVAANYTQFASVAPDAESFRQYLEWQNFFIFIITVWAGAGLIANDRRANALQIYLSKPLMRSEYIVGKLAVLFSFLLLITFVPSMLLLLLKVLFDGNFTFLRQNLFLVPAITVASLIQVTVVAFLMLALSSLSKSARYVGILYVGITFFTSAIYGVLYAITGSSRIAWISVNQNVLQVVDVVFRLKPRYAVPWQVSLLVLVAVVAVSISILERKVRGVEVVT